MLRLAANFVRPVVGLFAALVFLAPASPALGASAVTAHPALWTVYGPKGKAYMLGSIHVLPPNIQWKTPEIMKAVAEADTFVFEIPLDHQDKDAHKIQDVQKKVMDQNGMLPPGQSLRGALPEAMQADYDKALADLAISPTYMDRLQPWLAAVVLENAQFFRSDLDAMLGVDRQVYQLASAAKKTTRGFETLEDQLALITPEEQKAGMAQLSEQIASALKHDGTHKVDEMVAAWSRGDVSTLGRISSDALSKDPMLREGLLDNRNRRWVGELKGMLNEQHVYFVTVGAAHLAGPGGVPALMRAAGYRVEGPVDATASDTGPALRQSTDTAPPVVHAKPASPAHASSPVHPSSSVHLSAVAKPSVHAKPAQLVELTANTKPSLSQDGEPPSSPRLRQIPKKPSALHVIRN